MKNFNDRIATFILATSLFSTASASFTPINIVGVYPDENSVFNTSPKAQKILDDISVKEQLQQRNSQDINQILNGGVSKTESKELKSGKTHGSLIDPFIMQVKYAPIMPIKPTPKYAPIMPTIKYAPIMPVEPTPKYAPIMPTIKYAPIMPAEKYAPIIPVTPKYAPIIPVTPKYAVIMPSAIQSISLPAEKYAPIMP